MRSHAPTAFALLLALALPLAAADAEAQDGTLSAKQVEYYQKGLEAYKDGDYDRSIEYYELALERGEWNILYLGIGRALSRKGKERCQDADDFFVKAIEARPVPSPPPETIKAKIDEYRIDLRLGCDGTLVVECTPADAEVRVGSSARRACSEFPLGVPPGDIKVTAYAYGEVQEQSVTVKGLEETKVTVKIDKPKGWKPGDVGPKESPPDKPDPEPAPAEGPGLALYGYITGGVGVAMLGGALVTDLVLTGGAIDDLKAGGLTPSEEDALISDAGGYQSLSLGLYLGGAVLTGVGAASILWPTESSAEEAPTSTLTPMLSPGSAGVLWTSPF